MWWLWEDGFAFLTYAFVIFRSFKSSWSFLKRTFRLHYIQYASLSIWVLLLLLKLMLSKDTVICPGQIRCLIDLIWKYVGWGQWHFQQFLCIFSFIFWVYYIGKAEQNLKCTITFAQNVFYVSCACNRSAKWHLTSGSQSFCIFINRKQQQPVDSDQL